MRPKVAMTERKLLKYEMLIKNHKAHTDTDINPDRQDTMV